MNLRAHYFQLNDCCLYCGQDGSQICRVTIVDGQLQGVAVMCKECGVKERDMAIEKGYHEVPSIDKSYIPSDWVHLHNKGEKN